MPPLPAVVAGRATTESRRVRSYSEEVRAQEHMCPDDPPAGHPASVSDFARCRPPVQVEYQEQQARLAKAKKQAAQVADDSNDAQQGEDEDVMPVRCVPFRPIQRGGTSGTPRNARACSKCSAEACPLLTTRHPVFGNAEARRHTLHVKERSAGLAASTIGRRTETTGEELGWCRRLGEFAVKV